MANKNTTSKSAGEAKQKASGSKSGKPAATKKSVSKAGVAKRKLPTHEEISQKAHEIYLERISKGEPGDPDSDWHKALDNLQT